MAFEKVRTIVITAIPKPRSRFRAVLKSDLPHVRCRVKLRLKDPKAALALSEARNLPAQYICRLIAFSRLICPSMGPLLDGVVIDSFTASKSRRSVLANWAVKRNPETVAESIHVFSLLALCQRSMARN